MKDGVVEIMSVWKKCTAFFLIPGQQPVKLLEPGPWAGTQQMLNTLKAFGHRCTVPWTVLCA